MKLTIKTLKGEKFDVQVEETNTLAEVKGIIESQKAELPASGLKLIHSGKILKDADVISACGIKENEFLVAMVSKPKKAAAAPAAAAETAATTVSEPPATTAPTATTTDAPSTPAPTATSTPNAPAAAGDTFPDEVVTNLTSMGFPEAEVRHCLRAAHGNPDVAVEFLTNGIPEDATEAASLVNSTTVSSGAAVTTPAAAASGGRPLQALRSHPQFNALRRLVQTNPGALQQVLGQIGQQQPDLLAEINANQALFLEMMNEPIDETAAAAAASSGRGAGARNAAGAGAMMDGMGVGNPAQMAQLIEGMSEAELQQMANMMGLPPDQLRATAQVIGQIPPDQLNQFMMQAMGEGAGGGGGHGGQQVLRLTEEEMAAVDRLTEMGFDRSEAAQAFLACDKNEALAANLLMDSMANGGFFGGDGGSGPGNDGGGDNDDDDNMYD